MQEAQGLDALSLVELERRVALCPWQETRLKRWAGVQSSRNFSLSSEEKVF